MPRDITVTFADGSTTVYKGAPDDVTPEMVTERAQQEYGSQVVGLDGGKGNALERGAKLVSSAAVRGAAALPALGVDAVNYLSEGKGPVGFVKKYIRALTGAEEPQPMAMSKKLSEFGAKPETTGEKYLSSAVEGVAGGVLGPGGLAAPVKSAIIGLGAGLGGEAGGQLTGDNILGRVAGALAGGGAAGIGAGLATRLRPQSADLAREALEGIDRDMLKAAVEMQARAKTTGVNMDLAQALEAVGAPASNLTTLRNVLANSRHGTVTQAMLRQQPRELEMAADTAVAKLPGPQWGQGPSANAVQEAATKVMNSAKQSRSGQVNALYAQAGELPEGGREALLKSIDNLMDKPGNTETFTKAAESLRARLSASATSAEEAAVTSALEKLANAPRGKAKALAAQEVKAATEVARAAQAKPLNALDVDAAISDTVGQFKGTPLTPADPRSAGQVKNLGKTVSQELQTLSPELEAAGRAYSQISQEVVDPLKQSVVGRLATSRGYRPDIEASSAKLESIFSRGSDAQVAEGARDIPKMFNELRKVDKDAAPAAAKAFIRSRMDKAFGSTPGEVIPGAISSPDAAKALKDSLFASRAQEQGMKDIAVGIARSYDLPEHEVVRGLSHFMQVTKGLASRPDKVGGLNWGDVAKAGGKSSLADVARVYGFMPFERVARKIEDAALAKTFQQFDQILTTREGADLLLQLSRTPNMSDKAALLIAQFGATTAAAAPDDTGQSGQ